MVKYEEYLAQMTNKKATTNWTYALIGNLTGMTRQNAHKIMNAKCMGSEESYFALDVLFQNDFTFAQYIRQFFDITLRLGITTGFIAKMIEMTEIEVREILECKRIPHLSTINKLEGVFVEWEAQNIIK